MSREPVPRICIACSIFRKEIERFLAQEELDIPVRFLGSMLHMEPEQLEAKLLAAVEEEWAKGNEVVLVYGDCCPGMTTLEAAAGVARTQGFNCPEIVLGRETYRRMRREGVFFLMPEWVGIWRRVFQGTLGLTGDTARDFMKDMHTRLVYLDTGLVPVPEKELEEIRDYTGLPLERMSVSLEPLLDGLRQAALRIRHEQA